MRAVQAASRSRLAGFLAVNAAAMVFGAAALFARLDVPIVWIVAGRAGFAALTLAFLAVALRVPLRPARAHAITLAWTGAVLAAHWLTFFWAVRLAGVAVGTLTMAAFPLFTILIESARAGRRPTVVEISAGVAILVAVSVLVRPGIAGTHVILGALIGLASAAGFSLFGLATQRLAREVHSVPLVLFQNAVCAVVLLPALLLVAPPSPTQLFAIALLGIIATALVHQLYLFGLKRLPAAVCGAIVSLEPVYAIVFAAALFGEAIDAAVIASAALIVGASLLLLRWQTVPAAVA